MSARFHTASIAVFTCFVAAALGVASTTEAFGASDIADTGSATLLPQDVAETARAEGETPVDFTIIPETPYATPAPPSGKSLAALVERHAGVATNTREEECLAGAIYFESRSEPLEGQLAVAQVIVNRAESGRFPSSICGVVFQPGQFSFVRKGGFPPIARGSRDWQEAVAIARVTQEGLWNSPAPKALFFHARHVSPGWRLTRIAAVGNHIFYR